MGPAAKKILGEKGVDPAAVAGSGKDGRITKADALSAGSAPTTSPVPTVPAPTANVSTNDPRGDQRVPMTRLRKRTAERLLQAQQQAAILTTFNEVNMQPVMDLRNRYKDDFEKRHGVKMGFMSFFVRAAVEALKKFPVVNAFIDGDDIVYHPYFDLGVAVSSERGLVVPILRNAETLSFAEIELQIREFGERARDGKLTIEELSGGTFTISNGGIFGSLVSTPILNPPQSAILGMHKIQDRPVVEKGAIVIRPMMYLAMSYDHRIVDGREAVQCLDTIKQMLEDPSRMLLQV
jgi:2-oxoglutarate dehydrogenase E2 component (dihydrolipoamide succinyltransferase)